MMVSAHASKRVTYSGLEWPKVAYLFCPQTGPWIMTSNTLIVNEVVQGSMSKFCKDDA